MHTLDKLIAAGYSVQNAKITNVSLNTKDYGCLTLAMVLEGCGGGRGLRRILPWQGVSRCGRI